MDLANEVPATVKDCGLGENLSSFEYTADSCVEALDGTVDHLTKAFTDLEASDFSALLADLTNIYQDLLGIKSLCNGETPE